MSVPKTTKFQLTMLATDTQKMENFYTTLKFWNSFNIEFESK